MITKRGILVGSIFFGQERFYTISTIATKKYYAALSNGSIASGTGPSNLAGQKRMRNGTEARSRNSSAESGETSTDWKTRKRESSRYRLLWTVNLTY